MRHDYISQISLFTFNFAYMADIGVNLLVKVNYILQHVIVATFFYAALFAQDVAGWADIESRMILTGHYQIFMNFLIIDFVFFMLLLDNLATTIFSVWFQPVNLLHKPFNLFNVDVELGSVLLVVLAQLLLVPLFHEVHLIIVLPPCHLQLLSACIEHFTQF